MTHEREVGDLGHVPVKISLGLQKKKKKKKGKNMAACQKQKNPRLWQDKSGMRGDAGDDVKQIWGEGVVRMCDQKIMSVEDNLPERNESKNQNKK